MKFDYLIVGAGAAGAVLAERLASINHARVLIVEKRNHIGGNMHDCYNREGILLHKYGPHFFRTDKKEIWSYLSQFTDWHFYEHKVVANVKGMIVPFPINLDTYNTLYNTHYTGTQFHEILKSFHFTDHPKNAEEAIINQVGSDLYEIFFKNYTLKQWGKHPSELDAETVKRVPVRIDRENRYQLSRYQGLPSPSYTKMFEKMLDHPHIHLMLNTDYQNIIKTIGYNHLIYTGPLDLFFDYKYGELEYRSLTFQEETLSQESYQNDPVVNYPNNYDFTRITEYKKMTGQIHPKTAIHIEYPETFNKERNEPYYPILSSNNLEKRAKYLEEVQKLTNVTLIGRLAEYRYYAMDEVVEAALNVFKTKFQKEF